MEIESAVKEMFLKTVRNILKDGHYKVFLFGSRCNGRGTERSDYDLGIEAENELPAALVRELKQQLNELPLMQKIDLVDFKSVSKDFSNVAKEKTEVLYEQ